MSLYDKASLVQIPSGTKSGTLYSVLPANGDGDFTHTRASSATRVNKDGLIESVAFGVPRLDYPLLDGVVQSCPALLLEPSRTNYVTYSNDVSGYTNFGSTDSANSAISPDGSQNASLVQGDGSQIQVFLASQFTTLPSAGSYTISVFAKKGNNNFVQLSVDAFTGATNTLAYFDLENGTTPTSGAKIENYGNGWYKCSTVVTIDSGDLTGRIAFRVVPSSSSFLFSSTSEASGKNVYVYGFQMEQESYPTSYIPTSGSTVTRSADFCNGAGTSAEFNDSEGVLFAEISALANDLTFRQMSINGGTTNTVRILYGTTSNQIRGFVQVASSTVADLSFISNDITTNSKTALKYKENDFALWVNGFEADTETTGVSFSTGTLNSFDFNDNGSGGSPFYGNTKQLMAFNQALTDSELEQITSWTSFSEMAKGQLYTVY
jgi:hypothetical protein